MAIRKISKKEEVVYKLLEPHSSGRQHHFDCEDFEWDEARYKYRSWLRRRNLGSFYVASKELELCKNEVPELLPKLEAFAQAAQNLKKAQDQFEHYRWEFIKAGKSLCKDSNAVHREYTILTPQEELIIEKNKDKKDELVAELSKLTLQLEVLPKRGFSKQKQDIKSEIQKIESILKLGV